jgi:molybdopterin molybdotransferase
MTQPVGQFVDVRMRGFRERKPVAEVLALIDARARPLDSELVPVSEAAGRVSAEGVVSAVNVPAFQRSAMDGYAVRAAEMPGDLLLVGESLPARSFGGTVEHGECVRVLTGAAIPYGADAVVMAEHATEVGGRVAVRHAVAVGKHVVRVGEDVTAGREVLAAGRRLRPQDVGLLASVGVGGVRVVRRPRVAILATGDELIAGVIADSNGPMLAALVSRDGGTALPIQYVPDRFEDLRNAVASASADVVLVSGGSSVGTEDHAPRVVAELGELAIHGVAVRPASPAGVGFVGAKVVFLLPGNPAACLCAYDLFAGRAVRILGGRAPELPYRSELVPLAAEITSASGRVDYVRVKVVEGRAVPVAAGGASVLSSTVAADGFVLVEHDRESLAAGEGVRVWLYE